MVDSYDTVYTHLPLYSKKRRPLGEIDILAMRDGVIDIYEVKCSHRITKARKQLKKLKRIITSMHDGQSVRTFFYCGNSAQIKSV